MEAARTPYFDVNGNPSYGGQALVEQSCASGQCHTSGATGAARVGAPSGMNFDMGVSATSDPTDPMALARLRKGQRRVYDDRDGVFDSVDSGWMPPGELGKATVVDKKYKDLDGGALPSVTSGAGKKILRNWLACGAPVVEAARAAVADPVCTGTGGSVGDLCDKAITSNMGDATWDQVYDRLIVGQACTACHLPAGVGVTTGLLDLSDKATAYAALVNVDTMGTGGGTTDCKDSGTKRVAPGAPDDSNLIHKILGVQGADPVCGGPMPTVGGVSDLDVIELTRAWIAAGAPETGTGTPPTGDAGM